MLCIGFVLCRYVFFDIHGMKQLPGFLFGAGVVSVGVSFFLEGKTTPVFTALAYSIGFLAGVIFQINGVDAGGGATNTLWIIWAAVFLCITLAGILCEKVIGAA